MALVTPASVGVFASVSSTGTCGSLAMASPLMADGRLSTLLKCSAQRLKIFFLVGDDPVPICTENRG